MGEARKKLEVLKKKNVALAQDAAVRSETVQSLEQHARAMDAAQRKLTRRLAAQTVTMQDATLQVQLQCFGFSRCISYVTTKNVYFYYEKQGRKAAT